MPQLIDTGSATRTAASPDVLCFPGDTGYDEARRAWNLAVDQRPAAVALPATVDDVVAAVDHARTVGLRVAVQGTGHGARHDLLDGTLLINTARMTGVEIDASARVATVAAGTIWIDVVDAAVEHGLTALHGSAQGVGVVGYSLGGGIGWLSRKHGPRRRACSPPRSSPQTARSCVPTPRRTRTCSGRSGAAAAASAS